MVKISELLNICIEKIYPFSYQKNFMILLFGIEITIFWCIVEFFYKDSLSPLQFMAPTL